MLVVVLISFSSFCSKNSAHKIAARNKRYNAVECDFSGKFHAIREFTIRLRNVKLY